MKTLSIDIETYSGAPLKKCGVYRYCEDSSFEILLFGYSADGGPVQVVDFTAGEHLPTEVLSALTDPAVTKWAFNAQFERVCLSRWLGMPVGEYLEPDSWRCTMVWAATLGLPLSLEGVGAVLGLEKQKLKEGKDLIRYFCTPAKDRDGNPYRHHPTDAPKKWTQFKKYNLRDVETEMAIQKKLSRFPVPENIWDEYHLDQEINDRGIAIDMELVQQAISMDTRTKEKLAAQMRQLTNLENPNSVQQMKQWLADNGLELDSLGKKEVAALLKTAPVPLSEVLLLRQQLAKSSVKKYTAMATAVCPDGRARGMFQFYGANRTGRWAGRIIQLQNLTKNDIPDLEQARSVVRSGDLAAVEMLYEDVPDTLSQLIRTAFVPQNGRKFIVSDFSAIEARVIAWFAGEQWRQEVFAQGGDIYCATASRMFHCNVVKHGENGHLRQKGKQAELACIAEGQLVLTDRGLLPIESVTTDHKLWDGENWVNHEGVIYKGEREVIEYEGLKATPDHLVWIEGKPEPVQFGFAASCGAHLVQTGDGGHAVRLGENYQCGKALEQGDESLLCTDKMHGVRSCAVAVPYQSPQRKVKGMSKLFTTEADTFMAGQTTDSSKTEMRESKCSRIPQLRGQGHTIHVPQCNSSRALSDKDIWAAGETPGNRPHQQRHGLCSGEPSICNAFRERQQQTMYGSQPFFTGILAVCEERGYTQTFPRNDQGKNHTGCGNGSARKTEKLASDQRKARLYDIRNAGRHHRFTVSGRLVHNCGYGGASGAMKAMGAIDAGMCEDELQPLVDAWRQANPRIVQFWWDVDLEVKRCVKERCATETHGLRFTYESGFLFIILPSGRRLAYVKPKIGENRFGGESITYEGVGGTKKWERLESYGPKFVENIVQATARDILMYAIQTLRCCSIVAHVHDELIIECDRRVSLSAVCEQMGRTPPWAKGLLLRADGYECDFYKKD